MQIFLLVSIFLIFYTYIGYGIVLCLAVTVKRWIQPAKSPVTELFFPSITLVVPAYNEADCIRSKIENSLALHYPADRLFYIFITDGSTDDTPAIVAGYPQLILMHEKRRQGKIMAMNRAMQALRTDLVVFTDANTLLNTDALINIARHFTDPRVGAVAGEKKIDMTGTQYATAGEGWYWRYESTLKKWESELYSVMGAAGELFGMRAALYEPVEKDSLVEDLVISLTLSRKGYRIRYEPLAYAMEPVSRDMADELKRKIRIAAGGIQTLSRFPNLLSFAKPMLSFEFISHRVLRWVVAPYLLPAVFFVSGYLVYRQTPIGYIYWLFYAQFIWYLAALLGWGMEKIRLQAGILFVPYYFCAMNFSMMAGMVRYLSGGQTVLWEKTKRT